MLNAFRVFLNKPSNLKSFIGTSVAFADFQGGALLFTQNVIKQVSDPREREIILEHYLDVEGCRAAMRQYHAETAGTRKNKPAL